MKLICIAGDFPLPANNGGRVDVWRRLQALQAGGHEVSLLCWYDAVRDGEPQAPWQARLSEVCSGVFLVPITRSPVELLRRTLNLWRMPSHAASRWVTLPRADVLAWVKRQRPDVILLDGLYGAAAARWLSRQTGLPILMRSHNIEHHYMRDQAAREQRLIRRLGLFANRVGLARFERNALHAATHVLDISQEDCAFWQQQGVEHISWLPTSVDPDFVRRLADAPTEHDIDVLYFGNLNTPNNVEAVRWLVEAVLPQITDTRLRITLAGSHPSDEVRALAQQDSRISLLENPEHMAQVVARAGTIVNPMRAGSGVNLKSVEMLFSDAALVSTSIGVKGLPSEAKACFTVADDAAGFAQGIIAGVARGRRQDALRAPVREQFSLEAVSAALSFVALSKGRLAAS